MRFMRFTSIIKRIAAFALSAAIALPLISALPPSAAAYDEPYIRVGLRYGSSAMASANLANDTGSGYMFGWLSGTEYQSVGYTATEKITINKDKNMYVASGTYYDSLPPSGARTIGAYHVDSGFTFGTFDEAMAYAASLEASSGVECFPAYIAGQYRVRAGAYTSSDSASSEMSSFGQSNPSVVGGSDSCFTVTETASGRIIFEYDNQSVFAIMPTGAEQPVTWFRGYKYNGAFEYRRSGGDLTVINAVKVGDYPKGVIPYEMNAEWHDEALKAQAVCAVSYALHNSGKHTSYGFDVCNTTDCQVYNGLNSATNKSNAACEMVRGIGIYYDGKICNAVYHSSNGGSTENSENIWYTAHPYLRAKADSFEDLQNANNGIWSYTFTGEELKWLLNEKGHSIGTVTKAYVDEYTEAGNVYRVVFEDASGTKLKFEKEAARTILYSATLKKYANSQRYSISTGGIEMYVNSSSNRVSAGGGTSVIGAGGKVSSLPDSDVYVRGADGTAKLTRTESGGFTVSGTGWGHNVGLSQYGAKAMAEQGYTYEQILNYYFTGITLQTIN